MTHIMRIFSVMILALFISACDRDGPAEETGEKIDDAVEETQDAMEDAADDTEDAYEDLTDDD